MSPDNIKPSNIIDIFQKESRGKYGIISIDGILSKCSDHELNVFQKNNNIEFEYDIYSRLGFILNLGIYYYNEYKRKNLKEQFPTALNYMGTSLLQHDLFKSYLIDYDLISKHELIDIFSDFCADIGMSVYNIVGLKDFSIDLYLTTDKPKTRTSAVFLHTGIELSEGVYSKTLSTIQKASSMAIWTFFVTTPVGVYKIGLQRLIKDMERLGSWLYIVDPERMKIFGITRGKRSKNYDEYQRDQFLHNLPRESIRSPSQLKKISMYSFNESESYRPHLYTLYELVAEEELDKRKITAVKKQPYRRIFKNLIVIEKATGIAILNYANEKQSVSEHMLSGFLTAMDNFVAEIGGSGGSLLEDINYQGFYVQSAYANHIKIALFLSEHSDQILKERLSFLISYLEERYSKQIVQFSKTADLNLFDDEDFYAIAKKILKI